MASLRWQNSHCAFFLKNLTFTPVESTYYGASVPTTSYVKTIFLLVKIMILKHSPCATALKVLKMFSAPHVIFLHIANWQEQRPWNDE